MSNLGDLINAAGKASKLAAELKQGRNETDEQFEARKKSTSSAKKKSGERAKRLLGYEEADTSRGEE